MCHSINYLVNTRTYTCVMENNLNSCEFKVSFTDNVRDARNQDSKKK